MASPQSLRRGGDAIASWLLWWARGRVALPGRTATACPTSGRRVLVVACSHVNGGGVPLVREKIWTLHQLQEFTGFRLPGHSSPLDQGFDDRLYLAVGQACVACPMQFVAQDIRAQANRFGQLFLCPLGQRAVIAYFLAKEFRVHFSLRLPTLHGHNTHAKMMQESRKKTMALANGLRYPQNRFMMNVRTFFTVCQAKFSAIECTICRRIAV